MRRLLGIVLAAAMLAGVVGTSGCGDDVKRTKKVETVHESPPEMVPPGEEVVE